ISSAMQESLAHEKEILSMTGLQGITQPMLFDEGPPEYRLEQSPVGLGPIGPGPRQILLEADHGIRGLFVQDRRSDCVAGRPTGVVVTKAVNDDVSEEHRL